MFLIHCFLYTYSKMHPHSKHMHLPCLQKFFLATIAADTIINQTYQGWHTKHSTGTCVFVFTCLWICMGACVSDLRIQFKARRAVWTSPTTRIRFPPVHQRHCLLNILRLLVAWGGSAERDLKLCLISIVSFFATYIHFSCILLAYPATHSQCTTLLQFLGSRNSSQSIL